MKKKIIAAFLTTAMTIGSLSGVTVFAADAGTDEKVEMADASDVDGTTITFWHSMGGVNGEAIDTLVKKFNDENEYGITVDAQYQGEYDDSLNKLKSAQIGNMGADLVQVYEIGTRFMIDSGWIVPMQQMIDADSYDVSEIEPNLAAYYTIDNELYSMRSTLPHRSCITTRTCLIKQASQKFRTAWRASVRSDRIFWTKAAQAR